MLRYVRIDTHFAEDWGKNPTLDMILRPRSIAVVGASRTPGTVALDIVASLVCGFTGPVYPINPKAASIGSIRAYPSIRDGPDPVDQVVIAVELDVNPLMTYPDGAVAAARVVLGFPTDVAR